MKFEKRILNALIPALSLSKERNPRISLLLLPLLLFTCALPAYAQGCTQCRDNAAATPPATQRAYRNAIFILLVPAGGLFIATIALFKREP